MEWIGMERNILGIYMVSLKSEAAISKALATIVNSLQTKCHAAPALMQTLKNITKIHFRRPKARWAQPFSTNSNNLVEYSQDLDSRLLVIAWKYKFLTHAGLQTTEKTLLTDKYFNFFPLSTFRYLQVTWEGRFCFFTTKHQDSTPV